MVTSEHHIVQPDRRVSPSDEGAALLLQGLIDYSILHFVLHGYTLVHSSEAANLPRTGLGYNFDPAVMRECDEQMTRYLSPLGLGYPRDISIEEMTRTNKPVVVKHIDSHRGVLKYLLETREQKERFLVWLSICNTMRHTPAQSQYEFEKLIAFQQQEVRAGRVDHTATQDFIIQEYVPSPGGHAMSIRVVVDGYGHIHFSEALIQSKPNSSRIICTDHLENPGTPSELAFCAFQNATTYIYNRLAVLLTHSQSPLYLGSKNIVSNYAQGSTSVPLMRKPVSNTRLRTQLQKAGIDPDRPVLPERLGVASSILGELNRYIRPYVGIDWIVGDKRFALAEVNRVPSLSEEMIDPPPMESPTQFDLMKALLIRITQQAMREG